jgi:hypothetical protein
VECRPWLRHGALSHPEHAVTVFNAPSRAAHAHVPVPRDRDVRAAKPPQLFRMGCKFSCAASVARRSLLQISQRLLLLASATHLSSAAIVSLFCPLYLLRLFP